jgi:integrase
MSGDITSDNIPLSEPIGERAIAEFAVDCNPTAPSPSVPFAVDCKNPIGCDDPEVLRVVAAARSKNTRRAYQSDVDHFITWGGTIPANAGMIARCLARHASDLTPATLARRIVGIRRAHLDRGLDDPAKNDLVRTVLRGIRRVHARPQSRVAPLVVEELLAICEGLGDSIRDIRDRALLLVGFAGAFRRSELVAVDVENIERTAVGLVITIRRSKTDQEGRGRKVCIPCGNSPLCPLQTLKRWLAISGIKTGAIFRPVSRGGTVIARRLSTEAVASIIKRHVKALGRDPSRYSGHSLRAGFASSAAKAGMPTWRIKAQTGHRSDTMLALYVREAEAIGSMAKPDQPASGG